MELISKSARESERSLGVEHDDDEPMRNEMKNQREEKQKRNKERRKQFRMIKLVVAIKSMINQLELKKVRSVAKKTEKHT